MVETYSISAIALEQYCLSVYKDRSHYLQFPKVSKEIISNLRKSRVSSLSLEDIFRKHRFSFLHPEEIKLKEYSNRIYVCHKSKKKLLAVFCFGN